MSNAIIKNKIVTIFGDPGAGKTFLSSFLAYDYFEKKANIFSNVEFFYKSYNNRINKKIQKISDIKYIEFQKKKGLIVIDEGGLNINSRRSMSNDNLEFSRLTFLGRKKNCDIIYISQLDYSIDKYIRDLSTYSVYMTSRGYNYLNFNMEIHKKGFIIGNKEIDLIKFANKTQFYYHTLESSVIEGSKTKKKEKEDDENINEKDDGAWY